MRIRVGGCTREFALRPILICLGEYMAAPNEITETDRKFLQRSVELAAEALAAGDEPFGSVLVNDTGEVLFEDRNRVKDGDHTQHPEFAIARWAAQNLSVAERESATVYTSGEHCPMCAAAHGWVRLGRIVYASSSAQLTLWRSKWGLDRKSVVEGKRVDVGSRRLCD